MNLQRKAIVGLVVVAGLGNALYAAQANSAPKATAKPATSANAKAVNKDLNTNINIDQMVHSGQVNVDLNVRYVNSMQAMQESAQGEKISKELETKRLAMANEIKQLEQTITQSMTEFKGKEATMSAQARTAEEAKIMKKRRDFETKVKESEEELKLAMQMATEELSVNVEKAIVGIAKAEGYDVVADVYTGRTLYASPKAMITDDLVKAMDKTYVAANKKAEPAKKAVAA